MGAAAAAVEAEEAEEAEAVVIGGDYMYIYFFFLYLDQIFIVLSTHRIFSSLTVGCALKRFFLS